MENAPRFYDMGCDHFKVNGMPHMAYSDNKKFKQFLKNKYII